MTHEGVVLMFQGFTGWHALIILVVILLLFGATKLPALAKSVGQSAKIFKSEMKTDEGKDAAPPLDGTVAPRTAPPVDGTDGSAGSTKP
jgi:sec-independent protein translocase protein TatA